MRAFLTGLLLLLTFSPTVEADDAAPADALTIELRALAEDFKKIIDKNGGGKVAIGEFSASSDVKGSVGPQLQLVLAKEFERLGVTVDNDLFRFEVKGDYQPLVDRGTQLLGVKLVGRLIDRETGEPLAEKPTGRFVFGAETVPEMIGLSVSGPPLRDPRDISDRFKEARRDPQVKVEGTEIRGTSGTYGVEILVKDGTGYVARKADPDRLGRPFVPLANDDIYGIRLINDSKHEAAVDLSIDGVSCFAFSEAGAKFWVLDPGQEIDVLGWHLTNEKSAEFKVVADFPDTAAAKLNLKPSKKVGLITVSFSACWTDDSERPDDEPVLAGRGTGVGAEFEFQTEKVTRTIGQTRDTLSIRYEREQ